MEKNRINAWFDGACSPKNPGGRASYGFVIKNNDGNYIHRGRGVIGIPPYTSNNLAEHAGLNAILKWLLNNNHSDSHICIHGDSNLVINQILGTIRTRKGKRFFGTWKIKKGIYKEIALENRSLIKLFTNIRGKWIPRELNNECDELSKNSLHAQPM